MLDPNAIPDPGAPAAGGNFKQLARARLHALDIRTPEEFTAPYGVDPAELTAFGLLHVVAPEQAARELRLNELYRAGLRRRRGEKDGKS